MLSKVDLELTVATIGATILLFAMAWLVSYSFHRIRNDYFAAALVGAFASSILLAVIDSVLLRSIDDDCVIEFMMLFIIVLFLSLIVGIPLLLLFRFFGLIPKETRCSSRAALLSKAFTQSDPKCDQIEPAVCYASIKQNVPPRDGFYIIARFGFAFLIICSVMIFMPLTCLRGLPALWAGAALES